MEAPVVQFSISELSLNKRGPIKGEEDINLFRFTLTYPAEEIPSVETVKTIGATKAIPSDWAKDFDKAIVFKTPIRGKTKLTIEVASVDKDSAGEEFFKKLFKSVFGAVLGVWTGGFGSAYVGAVSKSAGTSLIDLIGDDDDIDIIGKAAVMIDSKSLPSEIKLDLKVDKPVVKKTIGTAPGGGPARRRRRVSKTVVIPKGTNGKVVLKVESI